MESLEGLTRYPEFAEELLAVGGENINKCIQCGNCSSSCPSGKFTAYRTRMVIRKAVVGYRDAVLKSEDIWLCTTCYTCFERCPRDIDVVKIIMAIRNIAVREGYILEPHKRVIMNLLKTGHAVPIDLANKQRRKERGLPEIPPTIHESPKALKDLKTILAEAGFSKLMKQVMSEEEFKEVFK
jgi:heterodisulfide reductase subunit C